MNNNHYIDNLKDHHQILSYELSREDEKSERLFTLITAIFTVSILAIVYFFTSNMANEPKLMALFGFTLFLFYSLIVCGTSIFDVIYDKKFLPIPFNYIVHSIGVYLLSLSPGKIEEQMEIHAERDGILGKINDFGECEFNSKYKEFLQTDNKWKTYLIGIKHRVRRWGILFFGFSIAEFAFVLVLNLFLVPIASLIFSLLILHLFLFSFIAYG